MTLFAAHLLAPTWLSVAVASSKDKARPALDRTVCIEQFHEGLRITATDSYLLLTGFVPNADHTPDDEPDLDAAPYATATAIDPHGRARGLLGHALGLVAAAAHAEDPDPVEMSIRLGVVDELEEDMRRSFAGMDPAYVVLEIPDKERVKLRTYEGEFPSWRTVLRSFHPSRTGAIALGPARVEQLARVGKYHDDQAMRFEFGGENKGVRVTVTDTNLAGLVMPIRWDFDDDAPRVDVDPASSESTDG